MQIARLEIGVVPLVDIHWGSYEGFSLHGAFKAALLAEALTNDRACPFLESGKKYHPFVLQMPAGNGSIWSREQLVCFHLLLFGSALGEIPLLVRSLIRMGELGVGIGHQPFRLEHIFSVGDDFREPLYPGETQVRLPWAVDFELFQKSPPAGTDLLQVEFLTPADLNYKGKKVDATGVTFQTLMSCLLTRLSTLSMEYGQRKFDWDYEGLLHRAERLRCVASQLRWAGFKGWSKRQGQLYSKEGIVGRVVYTGPGLQGFWPYFKFGEYTHLGGGTAYGMGQYQVRWVRGGR